MPGKLIGGKMRELSQLLIKAKETKKFEDILEFENLIHKIEELREYILDWDIGAGEEWARFFTNDSGIVLMLHIKIGIVFLRKGYVSKAVYSALEDLFIVEVDNYGTDEWCIDLTKVKSDLPEIEWVVSKEAVNPEKMSLQDLYWATV